MRVVTVYDGVSGQIDRILTCTEADFDLNIGEGEVYLEGRWSGATHYIEPVTLQPLEKQDYVLEALPLPCTITIEGVVYTDITAQPTFEFSAPGAYIIEVDAGPAYLKKEFTYDYQP
jgi:hypothetical protein